jgi:Fe-S-cluster containining protein
MNARAVGPLGHSCTGCGGSCMGVRVRLVSDEETLRVRTLGAELGVDAPVEDGRLRFVDGACVFLDAAGCRLHGAYGAASKPAICRQYPLVLLDTGDDQRVGIDPGCYTAFATRAAAPPSLAGLLGHHVPLDAAAARQEAAVGAILGVPGRTVAGALAALLGAPATADGALPAGYAARWIRRLQAAPLAALVARPETGDAVRAGLAPLLAALPTLDAAAPPPWPALAPEADAWAVEVAGRMVALRLCSTFPFVPGVALLTLGGAVALAWADPRPEPFARGLAAWSRALRAPPFWQALVPGPEALRELVGG